MEGYSALWLRSVPTEENRGKCDVFIAENRKDTGFVDEAEKWSLAWFARFLCFIRVQKRHSSSCCWKETFSNVEYSKEVNGSDKCCSDEYRFMQFFEVLDDKKLRTGKTGQLHGCIHLKWHRTSSKPAQLLPAKEYRLVHVQSICGVVNFVPKILWFLTSRKKNYGV